MIVIVVPISNGQTDLDVKHVADEAGVGSHTYTTPSPISPI